MDVLSQVVTFYRHLIADCSLQIIGFWLLFIFVLKWAFAYEQLVAVWSWILPGKRLGYNV